MKRNERISKKIAELPQNEKEEFRKLYPYERISSEDRNTYKHVSHLMERKPYFVMRIMEEDEIYNRETVKYESQFALFSIELIELCLNKLLAFIKEYKIKELPNEEQIGVLIDDYNNHHKNKLQKSDMIQVYLQLVQFGSFKEAAKAIGHSRATLYRYKERFKKIGISENNVHPNKPCTIPEAPLDFKEYHAFLFYNNILKGIKIC